jgi:hypothetical protein
MNCEIDRRDLDTRGEARAGVDGSRIGHGLKQTMVE